MSKKMMSLCVTSNDWKICELLVSDSLGNNIDARQIVVEGDGIVVVLIFMGMIIAYKQLSHTLKIE